MSGELIAFHAESAFKSQPTNYNQSLTYLERRIWHSISMRIIVIIIIIIIIIILIIILKTPFAALCI